MQQSGENHPTGGGEGGELGNEEGEGRKTDAEGVGGFKKKLGSGTIHVGERFLAREGRPSE